MKSLHEKAMGRWMHLRKWPLTTAAANASDGIEDGLVKAASQVTEMNNTRSTTREILVGLENV